MTITHEHIQTMCPSIKDIADKFIPFINKYSEQFGITTKLRMAHFLAQVCHESGEFRHTEENLNYSAERLLSVFPKYFNAKRAAQYAHKPFAIGSRIYANRMGNGDEVTQEGYKYRGRGLIQITGKNNYESYNKVCDYDVLFNPDILAQPEEAVRSAMWFWKSRGLNELADSDNLNAITKRINGGFNGLSQRKLYYLRIKVAL